MLNLIFLNCELGSRLKKIHEKIPLPIPTHRFTRTRVSALGVGVGVGMSRKALPLWMVLLCRYCSPSVPTRPAVGLGLLESPLSKRRVGKSRSLRFHMFLRKHCFLGFVFVFVKTQRKDQITLEDDFLKEEK